MPLTWIVPSHFSSTPRGSHFGGHSVGAGGWGKLNYLESRCVLLLVPDLVVGSPILDRDDLASMIEGLRFKLRMSGVEIDGPCNLFCDNNAVVLNSSVPESMLKKKHAAINYHRAREAIAAGVICVAKESTATNIADLLTKCLPGPSLREHANRVLW